MTPTEMRVAIARDIIKQLNAKLITPTTGVYIDHRLHLLAGEEGRVSFDESLQPYLLSSKRSACEVCALGAALIAAVRLDNGLRRGQCFNIHAWLSKYFTMAQLNCIEDLFEGFGGTYTLKQLGVTTRLRWIWSWVAQHPDFKSDDLYRAAL